MPFFVLALGENRSALIPLNEIQGPNERLDQKLFSFSVQGARPSCTKDRSPPFQWSCLAAVIPLSDGKQASEARDARGNARAAVAEIGLPYVWTTPERGGTTLVC